MTAKTYFTGNHFKLYNVAHQSKGNFSDKSWLNSLQHFSKPKAKNQHACSYLKQLLYSVLQWNDFQYNKLLIPICVLYVYTSSTYSNMKCWITSNMLPCVSKDSPLTHYTCLPLLHVYTKPHVRLECKLSMNANPHLSGCLPVTDAKGLDDHFPIEKILAKWDVTLLLAWRGKD